MSKLEFIFTRFDPEGVLTEAILIFLSILIGIIIGAEREYRGKFAGLRTFTLVSFGSCLFTILSVKIGLNSYDRIAANIITGIGFLGAGVIFKDQNKINGITTATTIWATASLGMAAGSGHIYLTILGVLIVVVSLRCLLPLQRYIDNLNKVHDYKITTHSLEEFEYVKRIFAEMHLKCALLGQDVAESMIESVWTVSGNAKDHERLVQRLLYDKKIVVFKY